MIISYQNSKQLNIMITKLRSWKDVCMCNIKREKVQNTNFSPEITMTKKTCVM